jgi:hypothetical protein
MIHLLKQVINPLLMNKAITVTTQLVSGLNTQATFIQETNTRLPTMLLMANSAHTTTPTHTGQPTAIKITTVIDSRSFT